MLARVTAVALWDALRTHPFTKVIWEFWQFLLVSAHRLPMTLWSTDDASSNRKVKALHHIKEPVSSLTFEIKCQNHQNFIGELHTTMIIFGRSLIRSQVFAARFFNMGCHRLRCVMVLFASGQQSPQDALFATEFQHYIGYWAGTDTELNAMKKAKKKKNQRTSKQSRISKIDLLEQFFSIVGAGTSKWT